MNQIKKTAEDFALERNELALVVETLEEVQRRRKALSSGQVDTLLIHLFDAIELRCLEVIRRKKGTFVGEPDPSTR